MKISTLFSALVVGGCCLLFASQARANSTSYTSSIISYDPATDTITASGTTEPDYLASVYYESRVMVWLKDEDGNVLTLRTANDTDGAGYVSVTSEYTGTTPGVEYRIESLHGLIMGVQDPVYGYYYDDYYNYGRYASEGVNEPSYYFFTGPGPLVRRNTEALSLGRTYDQTITPPKITAIAPNQGLIGNTIGVLIDGKGFRSGATVNAGSGIATTVTYISDTQMSATFDIDASTSTGGSHAVTVTSRGKTSASNAAFYVQIPTSLDGPDIGDLHTYNGGPLLDCHGSSRASAAYGYARFPVYVVLDQRGTPISQGGMTATEAVYKVSANPVNIAPDLYESSTTVNPYDGTFCDTLALFNPTPPAPQSGHYAKTKQFLNITMPGRSDTVRVNCLNAQYNDVSITDTTSNPNASCQ
jgi:hypothetical protein